MNVIDSTELTLKRDYPGRETGHESPRRLRARSRYYNVDSYTGKYCFVEIGDEPDDSYFAAALGMDSVRTPEVPWEEVEQGSCTTSTSPRLPRNPSFTLVVSS
jgi:hypothetical protein